MFRQAIFEISNGAALFPDLRPLRPPSIDPSLNSPFASHTEPLHHRHHPPHALPARLLPLFLPRRNMNPHILANLDSLNALAAECQAHLTSVFANTAALESQYVADFLRNFRDDAHSIYNDALSRHTETKPTRPKRQLRTRKKTRNQTRQQRPVLQEVTNVASKSARVRTRARVQSPIAKPNTRRHTRSTTSSASPANTRSPLLEKQDSNATVQGSDSDSQDAKQSDLPSSPESSPSPIVRRKRACTTRSARPPAPVNKQKDGNKRSTRLTRLQRSRASSTESLEQSNVETPPRRAKKGYKAKKEVQLPKPEVAHSTESSSMHAPENIDEIVEDVKPTKRTTRSQKREHIEQAQLKTSSALDDAKEENNDGESSSSKQDEVDKENIDASVENIHPDKLESKAVSSPIEPNRQSKGVQFKIPEDNSDVENEAPTENTRQESRGKLSNASSSSKHNLLNRVVIDSHGNVDASSVSILASIASSGSAAESRTASQSDAASKPPSNPSRLFRPTTNIYSAQKSTSFGRVAPPLQSSLLNRKSILQHTPGVRAPQLGSVPPVPSSSHSSKGVSTSSLRFRTGELGDARVLSDPAETSVKGKRAEGTSLLSTRKLTFADDFSRLPFQNGLKRQDEPMTAPSKEIRSRIKRSTVKSELRCRIEDIRKNRSISTASKTAISNERLQEASERSAALSEVSAGDRQKDVSEMRSQDGVNIREVDSDKKSEVLQKPLISIDEASTTNVAEQADEIEKQTRSDSEFQSPAVDNECTAGKEAVTENVVTTDEDTRIPVKEAATENIITLDPKTRSMGEVTMQAIESVAKSVVNLITPQRSEAPNEKSVEDSKSPVVRKLELPMADEDEITPNVSNHNLEKNGKDKTMEVEKDSPPRPIEEPEVVIIEDDDEENVEKEDKEDKEDKEGELSQKNTLTNSGFMSNIAGTGSTLSNLMSSVSSFLPSSSGILGSRSVRTEADDAEVNAKRQKLEIERREAEIKARMEAKSERLHLVAEEKQRRAEGRRRLLQDAERAKEEQRRKKEELRARKRMEEEEARRKRKAEEDKRKEERRLKVLEKNRQKATEERKKKLQAKRLRAMKAGGGLAGNGITAAIGQPSISNTGSRIPGPHMSSSTHLKNIKVGKGMTTPSGTRLVRRVKEEGVIAGESQSYDMTPARETIMEASDEEDERRRGKKVPGWAQGANLARAASHQADPDLVFVNVPMCNLRDVFGTTTTKKYRTRSSSANWAQDRVTAQEMMRFKKETGAFAAPSRIPKPQ